MINPVNPFSLETYRQAILDDEFSFYYQPIVGPENQVVSFESLMRWTHGGEIISPAVFIPDLEQHGLLYCLTEKLMHHAATAYDLLKVRFPHLLYISINIEPDQLMRDEFFQVLKELDANAQTSLAFEVVENLPMPEKNQVDQQIRHLRRLGIGLHLDDIGRGYATVENLCNYDFELGKIDRQILVEALASGDHQALASMMRSIHDTGHRVVVEGVETEIQLRFVRQLAQDLSLPVDIQGFYFSKPEPLGYWLDQTRNFALFS